MRKIRHASVDANLMAEMQTARIYFQSRGNESKHVRDKFDIIEAMKSRITVRLVVVTIFAALGAWAIANYDTLLPHRWQTFAASDGSFSIELPAKPVWKTIEAQRADGPVEISFVSTEPTKYTDYSCAYFEREPNDQRSEDAVLAAARDGSLAKTQGKAISEQKAEVNGFHALDTIASARGDSLYKSRIVVVGRRVYMISGVATASSHWEEKTFQRMKNSFKLLKTD